MLFAGCAAQTTPERAALDAPTVGVVDALTKIRPGFAVPAGTTATLEAARNEFEPIQIAIAGGANGLKGVSATASDLTGPGGIPAPRLYQVGLYHVNYASNVEGAPGEWPDPLIPDVDAYFGEKRNAFPFDVAAASTRAIWVELLVPPGTPAGMYSGTVTVSAAQGLPAPVTVTVKLRVRDFSLPSTPTLQSAFGFSVDNACRAHHGTAYCNSEADAAPLISVYGRAALDHRISFWNPYYSFPANGDFTRFDLDSGPLYSGTASTRLAGAHMTTSAVGTRDPAGMSSTVAHFAARGWSGLFEYTCDEPPATCAFTDIPTRAAAAHAAGLHTLVTTDLDTMTSHALLDAIDIACPVIDALAPAGKPDNRAAYDAFLARSPAKQVWTYQSCDEHGCGQGCTAAQASSTVAGWPSYMIDASALQNRAMQWLDYSLRVSGELYFETLMHLDDAWNSHLTGHDGLCDFGGNGDGALFYPGTPAQIGGQTDIPVESMRLQLIREGMEDYEYLHLLEQLGGGADARAAATGLFPASNKVTGATGAQLMAARSHLADLIEQRLGVSEPPTAVAEATSPIDPQAPGAAFDGVTPIEVDAGQAHARFRLLWDADALYLAADVDDATRVPGATGADGELWNADGIEVLLDPKHDRSATPDDDDRHVIITAAGDLLEAKRAGANEDRSLSMGTRYAVTDGATGYHIVAAIPWSGIGVPPTAGMQLGIDLALNDLSSSGLTSADWVSMSPFAQPMRWKTLSLYGAAPGTAPADGEPGIGGGGTDAPPPANGCAYAGNGSGTGLFALVLLLLYASLRLRLRHRVDVSTPRMRDASSTLVCRSSTRSMCSRSIWSKVKSPPR
jgi:hypothetical protein